MFRHAYRAVLGVVVVLGLALGTAAVVTSTSSDAAATSSAADCSVQQSAYDAAVAHQRAVKHKLVEAKHQLKRTKRALRRAVAAGHTAKAHELAKRVHALKKRVKRLRHRYAVAKTRTTSAHTALGSCLASTPTTPTTKPTTKTTTPATSLPIQSLCDAGIPQQVCDALAGLVQDGGLPTDLSLDALCEAAPQLQPLCDAASGGTLPSDPTALTDLLAPLLELVGLGDLLGGGLPSDLTSVQVLCDSGVPQTVCDGLTEAAGGGLPEDLSLTALCEAVPEAQPICDAANGPSGLPTDPSALTDLLTPVLETLGLDDLLCDLLGGVLCNGLP